MTTELEEGMKERVRLWKKAKETRSMVDELDARRVRNNVGKKMKHAKKEHLRTKMAHLDKNSPDSWAAVGEYLGWRKPMTPTMLKQDGKVKTSGQELAEAMIQQYGQKEREVEQALGPAVGDYLEAGRKLTKGNKGVFTFKKITKLEVEKQIRKVENKESFGHDTISYGFLKKMSRWISGEMTEIMNLSIEVKRYPNQWKVARVKPLFKGEGCDRHEPKSYRPVALLSSMSRIMEAILARQLDNYQEQNRLIHQGVHGFRKSRGTHTAMLEVWEFVMRRTERGELVALDFLDMSAGFDTLVHLHILRKMEIQFGMHEDSLEWLSSYLKGWIQYTVVEASNSTPRKTRKGAPQGGGLLPIFWRSTTNDIPEAGLMREGLRRQSGGPTDAAANRWAGPEGQGVISKMVDSIPEAELTTEEKLDKDMRRNNVWNLERWRRERTGGMQEINDKLKYRKVEDERDVVTTIYADDTQSRAAAKTLGELEKRNSEGLTRVCKELKAMRLKVNESKTVYMILATQGIRARENLENRQSEIDICGEKVRNVRVGKALGLLISDDLTWRHQTEKVVENCQEKMRGLWKITNLLRKDQRKLKAESIVLSRLSYCLEITSTGRKCDTEKLQGVQSAAARWVSQTRKMDWRMKKGLKKLGWLSICQLAAYLSIKAAMKILRDKKPERLYESLTEERNGEKSRKIVNEKKFMKMKMTTRKSWSYRSLRWLEKMPETLRKKDPTQKATKEELKKWVRDQVPVRGCRIMWGQKLAGDVGRRRRITQGPGTGGPGPGRQEDAANSSAEERIITQERGRSSPASLPSAGEEEAGEEQSHREVPAAAEEQPPNKSPQRQGRRELHQVLQSATKQAARIRSSNCSSLLCTPYTDHISKEVEPGKEGSESKVHPSVQKEREERSWTKKVKSPWKRQPAKPPWRVGWTICSF